MSSRFGRRKRRQARAEIERLNSIAYGLGQALSTSTAEGLAIKERYDVLRDQIALWDYDVRNMLSPYSALLFDMKLQNGTDEEPRQLPVNPPLSMGAMLNFDLAHNDTMVTYIERIHHLRVELSKIDPIKLIRYLRVRVTEDDKSVHYALSGSMLYGGKLTERDVRIIADDVARLLVRQLDVPRKRHGQ